MGRGCRGHEHGRRCRATPPRLWGRKRRPLGARHRWAACPVNKVHQTPSGSTAGRSTPRASSRRAPCWKRRPTPVRQRPAEHAGSNQGPGWGGGGWRPAKGQGKPGSESKCAGPQLHTQTTSKTGRGCGSRGRRKGPPWEGTTRAPQASRPSEPRLREPTLLGHVRCRRRPGIQAGAGNGHGPLWRDLGPARGVARAKALEVTL